MQFMKDRVFNYEFNHFDDPGFKLTHETEAMRMSMIGLE
jgi:hypothetical protein